MERIYEYDVAFACSENVENMTKKEKKMNME
jgi:hypothetical protein